MATEEYVYIIVAFLSFFMLFYFVRDKNGLPTNWPLVGMLLPLLRNVHRINDWATEILEKSEQNFIFKGPWGTKMELLVTADPRNIHHIMSKNFNNYPKGAKFNEIFDVLGEGIFNADAELWKYHRRLAQSFIGHPQFQQFLIKKVCEKVEKGLIPVLDHACEQGLELDLQDLFDRFTFDNICSLTMGYELGSLCIDLPSVPFSKALDDVEEVILFRHVIPVSVWKFFRWIRVGKERTYKKAWDTLDGFIYDCIAKKQEERKQFGSFKHQETEGDNQGVDLLTLYMDKDDKFLRDTILNFFIAGRDTTSTALSWFFYLLSKSPHIESKIREELDHVLKTTCVEADYDLDKKLHILLKNFKEISGKLVYLHSALCEALRLYPPVVFQAKNPVELEILPSGHQVKPQVQIIFNLYAMARMKAIWGEDCSEFKPERWISEKGKIKHEPSYKFLSFNAGPRTCVGKDMAFTQMKIVVASTLLNYKLEAVEGHPVVADPSIILHMKYGFKVKFSVTNDVQNKM